MSLKRIICSVGCLLCAFAAVARGQDAGDTAMQASVYRDSIAQDQLRLQTEALRQELTQLLDDYRQSHVSDGENTQLQQAVERLRDVGDKDMTTVVRTLREVSKLKDTSTAQDRLVSAGNEQKSIQSALKKLADLLTLRQTQESVQQRLVELVLRQTTNLRLTRELAATGLPLKSMPRELQGTAKVCIAEQTALSNEANLLVDALGKAASTAGTDPVSALFGELLALCRNLHLDQQAVVSAADTNSKDFAKASNSQETLLTSLQMLAEKLDGNQSVAERLRTLSTKMQDLAASQQTLAQSTQTAKPAAVGAIRDQQGKLGDQAAVLKAEIAGLDAGTAARVEPAEQALRTVDDLLKKPDALADAAAKHKHSADYADERNRIADAQAEATRQLQATAAALEKQADTSAGNPNLPVTNAAQAAAALQQLGQEIGRALAVQQALAAAPAAPAAPANAAQQQQVAAAVATLQRQALPLDTGVANTLGQAVSKMQQTQNAQTPNAAAQAAASLAQAQAQVQQEAAQVAAAAEAQQAVQGLLNLITGARAEVTKAAGIMEHPIADNLMPAIEQMAPAEANLQQALVFTARAGSIVPAESKGILSAAQSYVAASRMQAAQTQKKNALAANARARTELDALIKLLQQSAANVLTQAMPESALAQNRQQASEPPQNPPGTNQQAASQSSATPQAGNQQAANPQQSGQQPPATPQAGQQQASNQPQAGKPSASQQPAGQNPAQQQPGQPQGSQAAANPQGSNQQASNQTQAGQQPGAGEQAGSENEDGSTGTTAGTGVSMKKDHNVASWGDPKNYSMVHGGLNAKSREAVVLFQKEKVPPEYSEMVQQYSRNLAEGRTP